jgi:hypothetical protein
MDKETQQLINEQLLNLPQNFQAAIAAVPWEKNIDSTLSSLNLTAEQKEVAKRETMLIVYGFESPSSFIQNLTSEGIQPADALFIAEKAHENIFEAINKKARELETNVPKEPTRKEIKKEVIEKLTQRVENAKQGELGVKPAVPEISPEIHPMIKKGEVAHEVPHIENPVPKTQGNSAPEPMSMPVASPIEPTLQNPEPEIKPTFSINTEKKPGGHSNPHYPGGLDPYREPLL